MFGISNTTPLTLVAFAAPNKSNCPIDSARLVSETASRASKKTIINPLREWFRESNAPALMSDSILFLLQTMASTFVKKSPKLS